jgi:hypothetical protein
MFLLLLFLFLLLFRLHFMVHLINLLQLRIRVVIPYLPELSSVSGPFNPLKTEFLLSNM